MGAKETQSSSSTIGSDCTPLKKASGEHHRRRPTQWCRVNPPMAFAKIGTPGVIALPKGTQAFLWAPLQRFARLFDCQNPLATSSTVVLDDIRMAALSGASLHYDVAQRHDCD